MANFRVTALTIALGVTLTAAVACSDDAADKLGTRNALAEAAPVAPAAAAAFQGTAAPRIRAVPPKKRSFFARWSPISSRNAA
jgi:hypothetical protein